MSFTRITFKPGVREAEAAAHSGFCRIKSCVFKIHSFHHRLANTKPNHQFNCAGVCEYHHVNNATVPGLNVSEREAAAYEQYLQKLRGK